MYKLLLTFSFTCLLFPVTSDLLAQDYGCDKCSMLREEYEMAESPKKEEIYAFFKQECLDTDTAYVNDAGKSESPETAKVVQVTAKGKCIDFTEVKQIEKATGKEVMSYRVSKKDTVYVIGSRTPEFPGGDVELVKYLSGHIKYPEQAKYSNITGTVYVKMVINKKGEVVNPKVLRSPDQRLSDEAIRCIREMPLWVPGEYKNNPVSMIHVIPVRFSLR
jgi:TonB family protein